MGNFCSSVKADDVKDAKKEVGKEKESQLSVATNPVSNVPESFPEEDHSPTYSPQPPSPVPVSVAVRPLPSELSNTIFSGLLLKESATSKEWRTRYIVVCGTARGGEGLVLHDFNSAEERESGERLHLTADSVLSLFSSDVVEPFPQSLPATPVRTPPKVFASFRSSSSARSTSRARSTSSSRPPSSLPRPANSSSSGVADSEARPSSVSRPSNGSISRSPVKTGEQEFMLVVTGEDAGEGAGETGPPSNLGWRLAAHSSADLNDWAAALRAGISDAALRRRFEEREVGLLAKLHQGHVFFKFHHHALGSLSTKDHRRMLRLDSNGSYLRWGKLGKKKDASKSPKKSGIPGDAAAEVDDAALNLADGVPISAISSIARGKRAGLGFTKGFDDSMCFSICYTPDDPTSGHLSEGSTDLSRSPLKSALSTLDLACGSMRERDEWASALEALLKFGV